MDWLEKREEKSEDPAQDIYEANYEPADDRFLEDPGANLDRDFGYFEPDDPEWPCDTPEAWGDR